MSAEWLDLIPLLLCGIAFVLTLLVFPGPPQRQQQRSATIIDLAQFRKARAAGEDLRRPAK